MNTRILFLFTITFFGLSAFSQQNDLAIINKYLENNIEKYSFKTNDINDIIINDRVDSKSQFISFYIQQRIHGIDIFNAISTGSVISLILPNAGDENFISVINVACSDFVIIFSKSVQEFGSDSLMS